MVEPHAGNISFFKKKKKKKHVNAQWEDAAAWDWKISGCIQLKDQIVSKTMTLNCSLVLQHTVLVIYLQLTH